MDNEHFQKIVYLFPNGNTIVVDFDEINNKFCDSWFQTLLNHLQEKGLNPYEYAFKMPDGKIAKVWSFDDGKWSYMISDK